jgi:hypothetical protein
VFAGAEGFKAYPGLVEPSLIRDVDGGLLFSIRSMPEPHAARVWRSRDGARSWTRLLNVPRLRANAPIVLNQAADGTPYLAADQPDGFRAKLCLWPLNAERTECGPMIVARDCAAEFGAPPPRSMWFADHAMATTVRLSDGAWHNLLSYRVMAFNTAGVGTETPTPHTGNHIEEVVSKGPARPTWRFASD